MRKLSHIPKRLRQEAAESASRFTIKHIDFFIQKSLIKQYKEEHKVIENVNRKPHLWKKLEDILNRNKFESVISIVYFMCSYI